MLFLNFNVVTGPDFKTTIHGSALPTVESVVYLIVTFLNYAKWATHFQEILRT